jgi:hypothetical protein
MAATLQSLAPPCLHLLAGTNTDSGSELAPPPLPDDVQALGLELETDALFAAATEARVHKSAAEVAVLRYVNQAASKAHVAMMQVCSLFVCLLLCGVSVC